MRTNQQPCSTSLTALVSGHRKAETASRLGPEGQRNVEAKPTPKTHLSKIDSANSTICITSSTASIAASEQSETKTEQPKPTPEPAKAISSCDAVSEIPQDLNLNNLWEEAYNILQKEDPKIIDAYERDLLAVQDPENEAPNGADRETQLRNLLDSKLQDIENSQLKITVNGETVVIKDQVRKIVKSILAAKKVIGAIVSLEPHASMAWSGLMLLLPIVADPVTQDIDAMDGLEYISNLLIRCKVTEDTYRESFGPMLKASDSIGSKALVELNTSFRTKTVNLYSQILKYQIQLSRQLSRPGIFRFLRDCVLADDWEDMLEDIKTLEESINKDLATLGNAVLKTINGKVSVLRDNADKALDLLLETKSGVERINQAQLLEKLHRAEYAAFNTFNKTGRRPPRCLAGTRVDILREIEHWGDGLREECIFWLKGLAGTGKSTLARTVSHYFFEKGRLGASFFFSRGKKDLGDATAVLTTIAVQLAEALPDLRSDICDAIEKHGDIGQQPLYNQWQHLIFKPLVRLDKTLLQPIVLVFVLDALDECEGDEHLAEILNLLTDLKDLKVMQVKVFMTSRPERSIYSAFREMPDIVHHDLTLHSVPKEVIDGDISIFLTYELEQIKNKRPVGKDWPGDENIQKLVQRADRLFIYAATVCRFVAESRFPEKRLAEMLEAETMSRSSTAELDKMYLQILSNALEEGSDEDRADMAALFKEIVGTIIILFEALPKSALTKILALPTADLTVILESLHSVLDISEDEDLPIQLFHLSFRDFLLSEERCTNPAFRINEQAAHSHITMKCLDTMSKHLRQDICGLRYPGTSISDVEKSIIEQRIPLELQYACRHWVHHLQKSDIELCDDGKVHVFLQRSLLHWIEALSLIGDISGAVSMARDLESLLLPTSDRNLSLFALVYDAKRFILAFRSVIEIAPLQIYSSALIFSPRKSLIRKQFWDSVPSWITHVNPVEEDWTSSLLTLEHDGNVHRVLFSSDGQQVISSGNDSVKIWDLTTGAPHATLPDIPRWFFGSDSSRVIALSPDAKLLACTSAVDNAIRIWDPKRAVILSTLEAHEDIVHSIAFSPDSQHLASAGRDRIVILWDIKSGLPVILYDGSSVIFNPSMMGLNEPDSEVLFSPDGQFIASHTNDCHIRLWHLPSGTSHGARTLDHPQPISLIAFSPNGGLFASSSMDGKVRIWDPTTAEIRGVLTQGEPGLSRGVSPFAFSADGELIACIARNGVEIWDVETLSIRAFFEAEAKCITGMAFSPNGKLLAAALDKHVNIWDLQTKELRGILEGHTREITSLKFSPNGQLLATTSYDHTVKVWDPTNASIPQMNETHITKVGFLDKGQYVACLLDEDSVELRDPSTGLSSFQIPDIMTTVDGLAFCPDKQLVASMDDDTVNVWNLTTKKLYRRFEAADKEVNAVAFSPDGNILTASYSDNTIIIWDLKKRTKLHAMSGRHTNNVNHLVFTSDGKLLLSGSQDFTMRLWNPMTGESLGALMGSKGPVLGVVVSSDDKTVLSRSFNIVTAWDLDTKQIIKEFDLGKRKVLREDGPPVPDSVFQSLNILPLSGFDWIETHLKCVLPLYTHESWVTHNMEKIIRLPGQYANPISTPRAVYGNTIALGTQSNRLMMIKLDLNLIPTSRLYFNSFWSFAFGHHIPGWK
ncbi:hypothetical protein FQN50_003716 [Emmonsiellopsis sp. PD_5]|nr:hypothetical protein FQN50_003716 [Emmonsiellopsis sp. PD_5]